MKAKDIEIKFKPELGKWFLFSKKSLCSPGVFIRELTGSDTIEEAHKQIEDIVGYSTNPTYFSPDLCCKEDAEKVIKYFTEYEDLFD